MAREITMQVLLLGGFLRSGKTTVNDLGESKQNMTLIMLFTLAKVFLPLKIANCMPRGFNPWST